MHNNAKLLETLFSAVNAHDHRAVAGCYHPNATFKDIAFNLTGSHRIHAMWHMICDGYIKATVHKMDADESVGWVKVTDEYTFSDTGRKVVNPIETTVRFKEGLISTHNDDCDPRRWAMMALGGVNGVLAGRIEFLRRWKAHKKLQKFLVLHPEYE